MFRIFVVFCLSTVVIACANQIKEEKISNGKWVFVNSKQGADSETIDNNKQAWQQLFDSAISDCEGAALVAPIPKPRCHSSAPVNNCISSKSFPSNFCSRPIINRSCDIVSTQQYKDALFTHVQNCMATSGWQWLPSNNQYPPLQKIIDTIPELVDWQKNNPEKWAQVSSMDIELAASQEYQNMPTRNRLLVVVEKVKLIAK